jgi:nitrite reductase/ring-hydroxylating ferredoxin subunit/uncharacterized membrane protein
MLKDLLQGKPLRHPLHTFLVHFPIGLFVLSLLLDIAARVWPGVNGLSEATFYSMVTGISMALIASIPGFVDYSEIRRDHPARKSALAHMLLNLLVVTLYTINAVLRWNTQGYRGASFLPLFLSFASVGLLSISGHLGGKLVFDDGISIGRHRRKTRTPTATLRVDSTLGPLIGIAKEADLADGETMRVQLDGLVIVVAKSEGKIFAFQEFCTHRFGPLSEGCIRAGEIECPWHRSRFDMRTGKVTHGPAKENLKSFDVTVRDGEILVSREPRAEAA